jgi:hypothetical protein
MRKVSLASVNTAPITAAPGDAVGSVETRAVFSRDDDPIHLRVHYLRPGASMRFTGAPDDRLIYVWTGTGFAEGTRLTPRSSAIVEHGASITIAASNEGAALVEFAAQGSKTATQGGGHVHLLPNECVPRTDVNEGKRVGMALHADSLCPTCKLWLHENDYPDADVETAVHSHSEHEVIFVRSGGIRLGKRLHGPGTALSIAADTKYGFSSGPDGLGIVNFRGAASTYTSGDGSVVMNEIEIWHACVKRPQYQTLIVG